MTCRKVQNIIYSTRSDEIDPAEIARLKEHLARCKACRNVIEEVSYADRFLEKIKTATPRIKDEQALADSILSSILTEGGTNSYVVAQSFLDRLSELSCIKPIRFAYCLVILFFGMMFLFMEYRDMEAIVNLEQKLGRQINLSQAGTILPVDNVLKVLYGYYKLSKGSSPYLEITNKLILMKKEDLVALLDRYQKLDKTTQEQLNELKAAYLDENPVEFRSSTHREEIKTLQIEIERLKNKIETLKQMEER